jgi:hypothetical protein
MLAWASKGLGMSTNDTNADRLRTRSIRVADHVSANSERDAIVARAAQAPVETGTPRILLVATVRWPLAARLAISTAWGARFRPGALPDIRSSRRARSSAFTVAAC